MAVVKGEAVQGELLPGPALPEKWEKVEKGVLVHVLGAVLVHVLGAAWLGLWPVGV